MDYRAEWNTMANMVPPDEGEIIDGQIPQPIKQAADAIGIKDYDGLVEFVDEIGMELVVLHNSTPSELVLFGVVFGHYLSNKVTITPEG